MKEPYTDIKFYLFKLGLKFKCDTSNIQHQKIRVETELKDLKRHQNIWQSIWLTEDTNNSIILG